MDPKSSAGGLDDMPMTFRLVYAVMLLGLGLGWAAQPAVAQTDARVDRMFEALDRDGDGAIDLEEARAVRSERFARADADGDGFVTGDELIALPEAMPRAGNRSQGQGGDRADRVADWLPRADTDGDGRLSRAEFVDGPTVRFDGFDTDGDGRVTREEMAAQWQKRLQDR